MTEENRRRNLRDEWQLCDDAWSAAELLRASGLLREGVGRYYYAVFHAARAALLSRGLEPRTHAGVSSLFSQSFVQTGLLPARLSRVLGRLQRDREQADYAREVLFGVEDVQEARDTAHEFREAVGGLLRDEGWLG